MTAPTPKPDVLVLLDALRGSAPQMPPTVAVAVIADLVDTLRAVHALAEELDARVNAYEAVDHIGESDSFDNGVAAGETTAYEDTSRAIRSILAALTPDTSTEKASKA